jgi:hypothetical protein
MELLPRMAFRCMEHPRHIHVPLFHPTPPGDEMLLVNFTTLRPGCVDDACILGPPDYPELTHASTVAYSRSLIGKKSAFCRALAAGRFIRLGDLPEAAWRRVLEGARSSRELSAIKKRLVPLGP